MMLELQIVSQAIGIPPQADFERWASQALKERHDEVELVIRVVDEAESRQLNRDYRGIDKPTNVLSFSFDAPPEVPSQHIGDLVICAGVVVAEALEQHKKPQDHWAHMVVHGVLHLLGYDHQNDEQADNMEAQEQAILGTLGISNPYEENEL